MSGKKQVRPKMSKSYGKALRNISKTKEEKEEDLIKKSVVDEDLALGIFK